jgi:hypothetical protein
VLYAGASATEHKRVRCNVPIKLISYTLPTVAVVRANASMIVLLVMTSHQALNQQAGAAAVLTECLKVFFFHTLPLVRV